MEFKERLKRMFAPRLVLKDFRKMYIDDPELETYEEKIKTQIALGRPLKTYYANYLTRFRRYKEAEAMFLEAIETEDEKAMDTYAFFLRRHGLVEEAIKYYKILIEKKYKVGEMYSFYSFCLDEMCEYEEAAEKALLSYEHGMTISYVYYFNLIKEKLTKTEREKEMRKIVSMSDIPSALKGSTIYTFAMSNYFTPRRELYVEACRKYQAVSLEKYKEERKKREDLLKEGIKWMKLGKDKYQNVNCDRFCEMYSDPKLNFVQSEKKLELAIINYQEKGDTNPVFAVSVMQELAENSKVSKISQKKIPIQEIKAASGKRYYKEIPHEPPLKKRKR